MLAIKDSFQCAFQYILVSIHAASINGSARFEMSQPTYLSAARGGMTSGYPASHLWHIPLRAFFWYASFRKKTMA
jgi:hypothetical protein